MSDRDRVIAEALTWLATPYNASARFPIKGKQGGCDCGNWLAAVYTATGVFNLVDVENLPPAWFLNTDEEKYLMRVLRHAEEITRKVMGEIDLPQPGDLMLVKTAHSKVYSHGAIIEQWPQVIHCYGVGVHRANALRHPLLLNHPTKFFSPKAWL
jgi:cell wall-associated NlpC family hydrolase